MDSVTAENIGKKARALKHCDKLLAKIDKNGSAKVLLNCTGVEFIVHKGDAIYLSIQKTKYALVCDIKSYEITVKAKNAAKTPIHRTAPAPIGAAKDEDISMRKDEVSLSPDELRRLKRKEYNHRYYEKMRTKKMSPET